MVQLSPESTFFDTLLVAEMVTGKITAHIPEIQVYKIEVQTTTAAELTEKINLIKSV